jgi:hypothetical protein
MPGGNTQTDDPKPGTFTGGRSTRSVLLARKTKGTEQSRGSGIRIYEKGQIHCICMDENSMMLRSSSTLFFFLAQISIISKLLDNIFLKSKVISENKSNWAIN